MLCNLVEVNRTILTFIIPFMHGNVNKSFVTFLYFIKYQILLCLFDSLCIQLILLHCKCTIYLSCTISSLDNGNIAQSKKE